MEGPLLCLLLLLLASGGGGGGGQLVRKLCYLQLERPEAQMMAYHCPGLQDPEDARFCCGTCQEPFCCASQEKSLDPTQCPAFDPVAEMTSLTSSSPSLSPSPSPSPSPPHGEEVKMTILWSFIGILLGTMVLWLLCRTVAVLRCPRVCVGIFEDEEDEEEEGETQMEEIRPPRPPSPTPSDLDDNDEAPPPYSSLYPLDPPPVPVTDAPLRMGPAEGEGESPAQLPAAEEGVPARLPGAEGGSPVRIRGAESEDPATFYEAEGGALPPPFPDDPPAYSVIDPLASPTLPAPVPRASRRKRRRAKSSADVRRAPAKRAGAMWEGPPEYAEAVGGAPPETDGAVAGAPPEASGAEGGAPPEASGAEGGVPAEPSGAEGGVPDEPSGAEGGVPAI